MQGELVSTFSSSFRLPLLSSAFLPVPKSALVNTVSCVGSSAGGAAALHTADTRTLGRPGTVSARCNCRARRDWRAPSGRRSGFHVLFLPCQKSAHILNAEEFQVEIGPYTDHTAHIAWASLMSESTAFYGIFFVIPLKPLYFLILFFFFFNLMPEEVKK